MMKFSLIILLTIILPYNSIGQELLRVTIPYSINEYKIDTIQMIEVEKINKFIYNLHPSKGRIYKIEILGKTSPEGPLRWNKTLSKLRYLSVFSAIKQSISTTQVKPLLHSELNSNIRSSDVLLYYHSHTPINYLKKLNATQHDPLIMKHIEKLYVNKIDKSLSKVPLISIGSNLLYNVMLVPNLEVEYYPTDKYFTFKTEVIFPWFKNSSQKEYFQLQRYMMYLNWYLRNKGCYLGWHISPYIEGGIYDFEEKIGWFKIHNENYTGYRGEFIGSGIAIGYTLQTNVIPRLKFDFKVALGYIHTRYKKYIAVDNRYPFIGLYKRNIFAPTEIGIVIKYETIMKKRER